MAQGQSSDIDSGILTLSIPYRCACAIRSRPIELLYGLFLTTQGYESRSLLLHRTALFPGLSPDCDASMRPPDDHMNYEL